MDKPYCPHGCDLSGELFIRKHLEVKKAGVRIMICPLCEMEIKITTELLPEYTCEKVEKLTLMRKLRKLLNL